jgi:hypothetical protein
MNTKHPQPMDARCTRHQALRQRDVLVLPQAEGQMVLCVEGTVWVTHEPAADTTRMRVRAISDAQLRLVPLPLQ